MNNKSFRHLDTISAMFVATLLITNILSSSKLVDTGLTIFNIPLIFDGGLIIFPICYIFGDILTEVYGFKKARKVIWLGFSASIMIVILVSLLRIMPGESNWLESGGQKSFDQVLFGIYSGGLILASLLAYLVGEFANSIVLAKLKVKTKGKNIAVRFITSTIVGQFLDTLVFLVIATLVGVFPTFLFVSLFLTKYIVKILIEIVLLPISTRVAKTLKEVEQVDAYDSNTSLTPFALKT